MILIVEYYLVDEEIRALVATGVEVRIRMLYTLVTPLSCNAHVALANIYLGFCKRIANTCYVLLY